MSTDISSSDVHVTDLWHEDDLDPFRSNSSIRCEYSAQGFCWMYQKYFLKVVSLEKHGESKLLAKFNFATMLRDKTVFINNVTEFKEENYMSDSMNFCKYKLLVSLNRENSAGSYLLIVNVKNQSITKCIECPFGIRSIEPIVSNNGKQDDHLPLCSELKSMCGIVALATTNATVMILDLGLDTLTNENFDISYRSPSTVTFIVKKEEGITSYQDLETKRKIANVHNQHICITLNDDCIYKGEFRYGFDEESPIVFPKEDVYISALKYFYQTNTLYIGYNFGGVHHFSLQSFGIYKIDPLEEEEEGYCLESLPVIGFSLQEPENDPKNFCYLWVLKGQLVQDFGTLNDQDLQDQYCICSSICLDVLKFENKNWIDNYGYLYSEFVSGSTRFHHLFTSNTSDQIPMNSIVVNYGVVNQGSIASYRKSKEDTSVIDTSLFYTVWQAFDDQIQTCVYYLMLFDLNQWYQAQMPFNVNLLSNALYNSFVSFYKLNDIISIADSGDLQDSQIDSNSFSRYQQINTSISNRNANGYESDILYYPNSLSFRINLLSDSKHLNVTYSSMQKKVLKILNEEGEKIWLDPDDFLNKCHFSGILSADDLNRLANSNKKKCEQILSIALDNNELPFLTHTINDWSSQTSELDKYGCNCKLFLDWLWNEVEEIKKTIDDTVVPLFDLSDTYDTKLVEVPLHANESKLRSLLTLLNRLKSSGSPTTEQGERELDLRLSIIQILIDYVQIILWCCACNLLPEVEEGNHLMTVGFTYPKTQFQTDYELRRKQLVSLNPTLIRHSDLLAIDGLILNTQPIHELWKTKDNPTGLYPPPSIYSLISIFLEDSVSTEIKHQIMLYVLLDIISYLSDRQEMNQVEKLETFQSCFNVSPAIVQSVQGIWALDHKLFDYSLNHFCEANAKLTFPNVVDDFKRLDDDLQRRILTSYLYQNKKRHSLQFVKMSNLFHCDTLIKQKLYISVMLSNKLVSEAHNFQRACRNKENIEELLFHFFLGCEQMKLFEYVFKFELDSLEKDTLIFYLLEISDSVNSGNLLIVYLLLNKKFVDAHKFLTIIEERIRNLDQDNNYYNKFLNIKSLVNSYIRVLPSSVIEISLLMDNHAENMTKKKGICSLPSQKSKHMELANSNSFDHDFSNETNQILEKMDKLTDQNESMTPFRNRIKQRGILLSENLPFVKDLTPRKDNAQLKSSVISNYSLAYNGDNSSAHSNIASKSANKLDSSNDTENCADFLSLLSTPKIDKQQRNILTGNCNPSVSGPSSILKVKQIMNSAHSLTKSSSSRKKKASNVSTVLSFHSENQSKSIDKTIGDQQDTDANMMDAEFYRLNGGDMSIDVASQSHLQHDESLSRTPPPMNPSFVFSPPLTRSKKKVQPKQDRNDVEIDHQGFTIDDYEKHVEQKKSARKNTKRTNVAKTPSKLETHTLNDSMNKNAGVETPTHRMNLRTNTRVTKKP